MPVEVGFQVVDRIRRQVGHMVRRIEANPLHKSILEGKATREGYIDLLQRMYSFQSAFESQVCERREWRGFDFNFTERLKKPLIEHDLRHLGVTPGEKMFDLPLADSSFGFVCGYLYVIESATLTGQNEFRILSRKLGIGPTTGGSYLHSYGDMAGRKWREVQDLLERVGNLRVASVNDMISGATDAYQRLDACLKEAQFSER